MRTWIFFSFYKFTITPLNTLNTLQSIPYLELVISSSLLRAVVASLQNNFLRAALDLWSIEATYWEYEV